ncbi:Tat pathway signal protein [Streptomyces sp. ADI97-07]|uniref:Tat pathway signal protein n=1 Tax=Streptomyces sp. ADI97-07 TaxID=1522762 RepID=UPI0013DDE35F|nr:Tat pathway signal protein [Streptomyces sp. ADI97-07]
MTGNPLLAARIDRAGLSQDELASRLNQRIEDLTGRVGKLTDRHVRNWVTGKTRWPHARQRVVLEAEFEVTAEELGFIPPAGRTRAPSGDPVRRRAFTTATASLAAAALLPSAPSNGSRRVGMTDADRLERNFVELIQADNESGIDVKLETRALAHAQHALDLQAVGHAATRVRQRLYYLAAAFTGTALWAAVDSRETQRASGHLNRAMKLAGMAGSSEMQMRLWGHAALLSYQQHHLPDALAAAEAGNRQHICRQDPLFRSLASARLAGIQSALGDPTLALRNLNVAEKAYERADRNEERAPWMAFFDRAELDGLSALVYGRLGKHSESEAHLHRTLARLRPEYRRNRTYYGLNLALSQLAQGELEQAYATVLPHLPPAGKSMTGRTGSLLEQFGRGLTRTAPKSRIAVEWADRRTEGVRHP